MGNSLDFFINFDAAGATKGVDSAVKQAKRTEAEYRKASVSVGKLTGALDVQRAKVKQAEISLGSLADKLEISKKKEAALAEAVQKGGKIRAGAVEQTAAATKKLTAQYDVQAAKVRQAAAAEERLSEELKRLKKEQIAASDAAHKHTKQLEKQTKQYKKTGAGAQELGKKILSIGAAALAVDRIVEGINLFGEFDDELRAIKTLTGATEKDFNRIKQAAYDMAGAAGGPKAIAAGMAELAASGASVNEILGITGIVAKLSGASNKALDFKGSADLLTNSLNQLQLQTDDAQPVADRLAKGWGSAGHDAGELGRALTEVLPTIRSVYGHLGDVEPLEKSIAVINILAEGYKKGSAGGHAFDIILKKLIKPMGEGAAVLEKYKESIKIFDDTGKMVEFSEIVDSIGAAGLTAREHIALFGEGAVAMGVLVANGGDKIRDMEAKIKDADGTIQEASDTLNEGLGGSLRIAAAELEKARLMMTDDFQPALQSIVSVSKHAGEIMSFFGGTIKAVAATANLGAGAIFKLAQVSGTLTDAFGLTDDAAAEWKRNSKAAFDSAADLGNQSAAAFRKAKGEIDPLVEAQARLSTITARLAQDYADVSKATGVTVTSMQEVDAALASGAIRQNAATGQWIGAEKEKQDALNATAKAAIEAASKAAESDKKGRKVAEKAWKDYRKVATKAAEDVADRTRDLNEQLSEMSRSGMSDDEGLKDLRKEADAAAASARKLNEAGKLKEALVAADRARELYARLSTGTKNATKEVEKQKEELKKLKKEYQELSKGTGRTVGLLKSEKDEIKATRKELKELKKSYKNLRRTAKYDGKTTDEEAQALRKARDAVEALEKKYKDLRKASKYRKGTSIADIEKIEKAKEEIGKLEGKIKGSTEALDNQKSTLDTAMQGVKENGQLAIDIQNKLAEAAKKAAEELDKMYDFDTQVEKLDKVKEAHAAMHTANKEASADAAASAIDDLEAIGAKADEIAAQERVVTVTIKEVSAASGGTAVGVQGAASGAIAGGGIRWANGLAGLRIAGAPSKVDTHPFYLADGETVTAADAAKNAGYDTWRHINNKNMIGAAKAMVGHHPHLQQVFSPPVEFRVAQPQQQQSGLQGMAVYHESHPFDGRIIKKIMFPEDREFEKQQQDRTQSLIEKLNRPS